MVLDFRPSILAIANEVNRRPLEEIAARFHNTLAAAIVATCRRIRDIDGLDRICLSGGTFQNHFLLESTIIGLRAAGFTVFLHAQVPANDGGIALGQAAVANELLRRGGVTTR